MNIGVNPSLNWQIVDSRAAETFCWYGRVVFLYRWLVVCSYVLFCPTPKQNSKQNLEPWLWMQNGSVFLICLIFLPFKQRSHWMLNYRCAAWQQSIPLPSWGEDRSSVHKHRHEKDRKHVILSQTIRPPNKSESKNVFIFRFVYIYNFTMSSFSMKSPHPASSS